MSHHHNIPVPRGPLLAAALLITSVLLAVAAVRFSGLDMSSRSQAPVAAERMLRFEDAPDGSVRVLSNSGQAEGAPFRLLRVIAPGDGGFLRGALRALVRERRSAGLGDQMPFRLVARTDGRLTLEDPATAQRVDLESFGPAQSAVFAQLLAAAPPLLAAR